MERKYISQEIVQGRELPLMEEFYTIQGEGFHKGTAAYFIRLGGCDVGCHWCDVKESWEAAQHPVTSVNQISEKASRYSNIAIITGGEPLTWNLDLLTKALKEKGVRTHIETSGAYPMSGIWDWVCLSPKKFKLPTDDVYARTNELKVVIFNKSDFKFAEEQAQKVNEDCVLYLQPEWSKREKMIPLIVDYVMKNPKWKVSLQIHKYLNIP